MMRIPWKSVDWKNSVFLIGTFLVTLTAVPLYLWRFGVGPVSSNAVCGFLSVHRAQYHPGLPPPFLPSHVQGELAGAAVHAAVWRGGF